MSFFLSRQASRRQHVNTWLQQSLLEAFNQAPRVKRARVTCYLASTPLTPHAYATAPSLQSYGSVRKDGSRKDGCGKDRSWRDGCDKDTSWRDGSAKDTSSTRKHTSRKHHSHLPRGINWCVEVQRRLAPAAPLLNTPLDAGGVPIDDL